MQDRRNEYQRHQMETRRQTRRSNNNVRGRGMAHSRRNSNMRVGRSTNLCNSLDTNSEPHHDARSVNEELVNENPQQSDVTRDILHESRRSNFVSLNNSQNGTTEITAL